MKKISLFLMATMAWTASSWGRPFETLEQVEARYDGRLANGANTPEHQAVLYAYGDLAVIVLYFHGVSEGEAYLKPGKHLTDIEVASLLDANKGTSSWRNERVDSAGKDAKGATKMWSRVDGKLYGYLESGPSGTILCIGTKKAESFISNQSKFTALIRARDKFQ